METRSKYKRLTSRKCKYELSLKTWKLGNQQQWLLILPCFPLHTSFVALYCHLFPPYWFFSPSFFPSLDNCHLKRSVLLLSFVVHEAVPINLASVFNVYEIYFYTVVSVVLLYNNYDTGTRCGIPDIYSSLLCHSM